MKEYIWLHHQNINYKNYPYRDSWRSIAGIWEFPVDRFSVLEGELGIDCLSIVKEPFFTVKGLGGNWKDRYFSVLDSVADDIYKTADSSPGPSGRRLITLLYSGGVDSLVSLVSLRKHPKYREFLESGRFRLAMTTGSINEYPDYFYKTILPEVPIVFLNFEKFMKDPETLLVTGDLGDYVIGSSDSMVLTDGDLNFDLTSKWQDLIPYVDRQDPTKRYSDILTRARAKAPFEIKSAGQMAWWISQCFTFQDEFVRPYIWSKTKDLDTIPNNDKVYRFFYNDAVIKFSYEFASTNPQFKKYDDARLWAKEYIVNFTGDQQYLSKPKVYSQRASCRVMHKTRVYIENGVFKSALTSEKV